MQPGGGRAQRAPGSFSPMPGSVSSSALSAAAAAASSIGGSYRDRDRDRDDPGHPPLRPLPHPTSSSPALSYQSRPPIRRIETSSSDDTPAHVALLKTRSPQSPIGAGVPGSSYAGFTAHPNSSSSSLHNYSRPVRPLPGHSYGHGDSAGSSSSNHHHQNSGDAASLRTSSPLTLPHTRGPHSRKQSQTQGLFDSTLPSASASHLPHIAMSQAETPRSPSSALSASQIAAQAAVQQHNRSRSQSAPFTGSTDAQDLARRPGVRPVQGAPSDSGSSRGPLSPPMLSLTEASVPRDNGALAAEQNRYHNGLLGNHTQAATAAANVVFPRTSPQASPRLSMSEQPPQSQTVPAQTQAQPQQQQQQQPAQQSPFVPPLSIPEKPAKAEKSKVKLFSRPKKIDTKGEVKEKPQPSPGKIGSALASLQRANYSTTSLAESQSMYNLANSSTATIRPADTPVEREGKEKEKEKKHHFLSRQKHKISRQDEYHLPLSSAASNSRPVDPTAPSSLYNFNIPPSPGPSSAGFSSAGFSKSVSGLDLRHGGRALREKRKEDKLGMSHENESAFTLNSDWPGPGSLGTSLTQTQSNMAVFGDSVDGAKYGLHNMTQDDAWPYLKAKLLAIFEGEDLRLPIEDFNRVVGMHIQFCVQRRSARLLLDDLRELLSTGFASLDQTLRKIPEDRLIPALVDVWMVTFTSILPYMQAVFLPLDLEFSGNGTLLAPDQAREFWGGVANISMSGLTERETGTGLDVRRLVLLAFRDALILPRYEKLRTIFSRLSLEHLPSSLASLALASPPPISDNATSSSPREGSILRDVGLGLDARPGTAMSLDPSVASYNSNSSTLLNDGGGTSSNPSRSRAISNVSYGSGSEQGFLKPFGPGSGRGRADSDRDRDAESGSKQVTDMVGRMLQCMSVLVSVGTSSATGASSVDGNGAAALMAGVTNSQLPTPTTSSSTPTTTATTATTGDEGSRQVSELVRLLKLNWLGRGRTGRNRRGMVGGRVRRDVSTGQRSIRSPGLSHTHSRANSGLSSSTGLGIGGIGIVREGLGVSG